MPLPAELPVMIGAIGGFEKVHKTCPKPVASGGKAVLEGGT